MESTTQVIEFDIISFIINFLILIVIIFVCKDIIACIRKHPLSDNQKKFNINLFFTTILITVLLTGITPISETMSCNENYQCKIQTNYLLPLSNKTDIIYVDKMYNLYINEMVVTTGKHSSKTEYQLILKNPNNHNQQIFNRPLAVIFTHFKDRPEAQSTIELINKNVSKFSAYLNNQQSGFEISSIASINNDLMPGFNVLAIIFIILLIWNIKDYDRHAIDIIKNVIQEHIENWKKYD